MKKYKIVATNHIIPHDGVIYVDHYIMHVK